MSASTPADTVSNASAAPPVPIATDQVDDVPAHISRSSGRLREKRVNYAVMEDDEWVDAVGTDEEDAETDSPPKANTAKGSLSRKTSAANAWVEAEDFVSKGKMKVVADDGSAIALPTGINCLESAGSAGYAARNIKVSNANFRTINNHVLSFKDELRTTRAEFAERFGGFKSSMDSLNDFVRNAVGSMQQSQASGAADIVAAVTQHMKSALAGNAGTSVGAVSGLDKKVKTEKESFIAESDVKAFYDQWEYERGLRNATRYVPRGLLDEDAVHGREEGKIAQEREEIVRALQRHEAQRTREREDAIRARERAKAAQVARIAELELEIRSLHTSNPGLAPSDFEPQLQSAAATAKKSATLINASGKRNREPESEDDDVVILTDGPVAARHTKKTRVAPASTSSTVDEPEGPGATIRLGPHNWGTRMREIKTDVMRVINQMPDCHHIRGPGTVTICKNKGFILMSMRSAKEADIIVAQWLQAAKRSDKFKECMARRCTEDEVLI